MNKDTRTPVLKGAFWSHKTQCFLEENVFVAVLEEGFSLILPLGSGNESNSFHRCSLGAESGTEAKPCEDCCTNLLWASVTLLEPKGFIQSVLLPGNPNSCQCHLEW